MGHEGLLPILLLWVLLDVMDTLHQNVSAWNGSHLSGLGDKCLPELMGSSLTFMVILGTTGAHKF